MLLYLFTLLSDDQADEPLSICYTISGLAGKTPLFIANRPSDSRWPCWIMLCNKWYLIRKCVFSAQSIELACFYPEVLGLSPHSFHLLCYGGLPSGTINWLDIRELVMLMYLFRRKVSLQDVTLYRKKTRKIKLARKVMDIGMTGLLKRI